MKQAASSATKRTTLVHVISNLGIGGAETVLYQLLCHLRSDEFDHKVIYFYDGPFVEKIKQLGIPVYQIKGLFCAYDPVFFVRFFRTVRSLQPDCLHTVLWAANFLGRLIFWKYKIPLVQVLHNNQDQNGYLRAVADRLSPKVPGAVVAVSHGVSKSVAQYAPWFDSHKIQVIQNGIDSYDIRKKAGMDMVSRQELGLSEDHFIIGTVGRFELVKNHSLLLTAFAILYDKYQKERLVLVGQGSQEKSLRKRAYHLGVEKQVLFITGQPAYRYYQIFDCFVMTSYKEGLSMALLEAMSIGVPCIIASDEKEHDVIVHNHNGLLISGNDPEILALTIDMLAQNPELRIRLGKAAKETVEKAFGIEGMIKDYANLYKKVANISSR